MEWYLIMIVVLVIVLLPPIEDDGQFPSEESFFGKDNED